MKFKTEAEQRFDVGSYNAKFRGLNDLSTLTRLLYHD